MDGCIKLSRTRRLVGSYATQTQRKTAARPIRIGVDAHADIAFRWILAASAHVVAADAVSPAIDPARVPLTSVKAPAARCACRCFCSQSLVPYLRATDSQSSLAPPYDTRLQPPVFGAGEQPGVSDATIYRHPRLRHDPSPSAAQATCAALDVAVPSPRTAQARRRT